MSGLPLPAKSRGWMPRCVAFSFLLLVAFSLHGVVNFYSAAKFEKIFADMMPQGPAQLPFLTAAVLAWGRIIQGGWFLLLPLSLIPFAALWFSHGSRWSCYLATILSVVLIAVAITGVVALQLPLVKIIHGMREP